MESKEYVLNTMQQYGEIVASNIQAKSPKMDGTQLYDVQEFIPDFVEAVKLKNMLEREVGFVCRSSEGRVIKLLQKYDSSIYTDEPEKLPAQWGFVWSKEPEHALPFVAISTSPYMKDDCAIGLDGQVYRSTIDNNVWEPTAYPAGWLLVVSEGE